MKITDEKVTMSFDEYISMASEIFSKTERIHELEEKNAKLTYKNIYLQGIIKQTLEDMKGWN